MDCRSAAERGDTAKVKSLLEEGKDVNGRNCLGVSFINTF
jgi:hypothetical protein